MRYNVHRVLLDTENTMVLPSSVFLCAQLQTLTWIYVKKAADSLGNQPREKYSWKSHALNHGVVEIMQHNSVGRLMRMEHK